jgi:hypothetical protein
LTNQCPRTKAATIKLKYYACVNAVTGGVLLKFVTGTTGLQHGKVYTVRWAGRAHYSAGMRMTGCWKAGLNITQLAAASVFARVMASASVRTPAALLLPAVPGASK